MKAPVGTTLQGLSLCYEDKLLIVFCLDFEIAFRMFADRTDFRGLLPYHNMAAI